MSRNSSILWHSIHSISLDPKHDWLMKVQGWLTGWLSNSMGPKINSEKTSIYLAHQYYVKNAFSGLKGILRVMVQKDAEISK